MRELVLRPSPAMRFGFTLLFVVVGLIILAGLKDLPPAGIHDVAILLFAGASFYAAVTYPLRMIVFRDGNLRVRSLGGWKTTPLPPRVRVDRGLSFGSIYLVDDDTGHVILILKREFGSVESLEARIRPWLRAQQRAR